MSSRNQRSHRNREGSQGTRPCSGRHPSLLPLSDSHCHQLLCVQVSVAGQGLGSLAPILSGPRPSSVAQGWSQSSTQGGMAGAPAL